MLVGALTAVAGCAVKPVLLDRASLAGVRQVALPTPGFPSAPTVDVTQGVGKSFGAIGLITTAVVNGNRSDALAAIMAAKGFDPRAAFTQGLNDKLRSLGFTPLAETANPTRSGLLDNYVSANQRDAVLDVAMARYGLIALSDADEEPYRPAVALQVRLVNAQDHSVLMQDQLIFAGIDAPLQRPDGPAAVISFKTFDQVRANPDLAVAAIRGALAYAVDAIGKRLT